MSTDTAAARIDGYSRRLFLGFFPASVLVSLSSIALGGYGQDAFTLYTGFAFISMIALISSALVAFFARRDLVIVFTTQAATIAGMFLFRWVV